MVWNKQNITSGDNTLNIQVGRDLNIIHQQVEPTFDSLSSDDENYIFERNEFEWKPGFGDIALVRAERLGVSFHPEVEEKANEFLSWAVSRERTISLQVLVGPAGSGKTRLMLEVCNRLTKKNWKAGFLRQLPQPNGFSLLQKWWNQITHHCFLVIDYAEARPNDVIKLLQSVNAASLKHQVRIVLLARNSQGWWYELMLKSRLVRVFAESKNFSGVTIIPAVGMSEKNRWSIFAQALREYSLKLGCEIPKDLPQHTPSFLNDTNGEPLYIHLWAISCLRNENPKSIKELLHFTLLREKSYWVRVLGKYGLTEVYWGGLTQVIGCITLLGGVLYNTRVIDVINAMPSSASFSAEESKRQRISPLYPIPGSCLSHIPGQ